MSIIQPNGYSDFKLIADTKHFKDVFYYFGGGLYVIYAIGDNGLIVYSGNLGSDPGTVLTDYPDAIALTHLASVS